MKNYYNPINIFKVRRYRKNNKNMGKYPYSGLEIFMRWTRQRKNNKRNKINFGKTRKIPKMCIYN